MMNSLSLYPTLTLEMLNKCEYKTRLTKNVEICDKCGCVLSAKTRVKDEYCLLKK